MESNYIKKILRKIVPINTYFGASTLFMSEIRKFLHTYNKILSYNDITNILSKKFNPLTDQGDARVAVSAGVILFYKFNSFLDCYRL